jgi:hypothetical protein
MCDALRRLSIEKVVYRSIFFRYWYMKPLDDLLCKGIIYPDAQLTMWYGRT